MYFTFTRRYILLLSALLVVSIVVALSVVIRFVPTDQGSTPRAKRVRDFFSIPAAAFVRPLGVIPPNPASLGPGEPGYNNQYPAGRGISLGGIGASSFMYNQAGTFGPWELRNGLHEERILPQAAFHVREQLAGSTATVRTLATAHPLETVLPAWHTLSPGDGSYAALFPFGWMTYQSFASDISMRFWSPIVAHDDERSSMPIAYFDIRLANHTHEADSLSLMFTFPNAPLCTSGPRPCTRIGFASRVQTDQQVWGVTLSASNPSNVIDAQNTEWTLAAEQQPGQSISYTTSWNANGDGSDIYHQFAAHGNLGNGALDASYSAGAIAVSVDIRPGQVSTVSFALAWDFPEVLFGSPPGQHTLWMKRYTSYFGTRETATNDYAPGSYPFHQGFRIAERALLDEKAALAGVVGWWSRIAQDAAYPVWLRQTALNELYYDNFGSSFWESGLIENSYPLSNGGSRVGSQVPGTHLFFNIETPIYRFAESYDVRAYENRQWLLLFPDIERDVQRAWTQFVLEDPSGHAPHDAGSVDESPYIVWPGDTFGNPQNWLDLPIKYIFQVWQYIHFTNDSQFLRYAYSAMLRSYRYVADRIPAGQYLPIDNGVDNTYDTWHLDGYTSYVGGLWILGQEVMLAATHQALATGIPGASQDLINQLSVQIPKSKSQYEQALWDPTHQYYRISTQDPEYGDGVMADAMFAQHIAEELSLPDIVNNAEHLRTHLHTSYDYLVAPWHDAQGQGIGAANGVDPNKSIIQTGGNEAQGVWTGVSYFYAATQYHDGQRFHDATLRTNGLNTAYGVFAQTYQVAQNGYAFDTPEAWEIANVTHYRALQYMRPRSVWELVLAIKQPIPWI